MFTFLILSKLARLDITPKPLKTLEIERETWEGARGSWNAKRFLKLDWSAERKRSTMHRSFSNFPNIFPISQSFHGRFL